MFLISISLVFLSACATDRERIAKSEKAKVERDAISRVAKSASRRTGLLVLGRDDRGRLPGCRRDTALF